jgi:hypothetical protein
MRTILSISLCLFIPWMSHAQTYQMTVSTEPYVDLSGGTPAVTQTWDDPGYDVPIGFVFPFYNQSLTTVHQLANIAFPILSTSAHADTFGLFLVFGADLIDRGYGDTMLLSPITYKTTGTPGQRVFTIEWKNAGFYRQYFFTGSSTDYVNFQMQLYEANGDIVYRFGPSNITQPEIDYDSTGAFTGLLERLIFATDVSTGEVLLLTGNPSNPTVVPSYINVYLNGTIPQNTVYTFSRMASATGDLNHQAEHPYFVPNPCHDYLTAAPLPAESIIPPVYIYDLTGALIRTEWVLEPILTTDLASGIYQLKFNTSEGTRTQRILVVH